MAVKSTSSPSNRPPLHCRRGRPQSPHTQETGHSGVGGIGGVQIHLVGVEPRGRDGEVAAQPVDVLHERHVHLQRPLP